MSERCDEGWFDFYFGMNDENGRLVQVIIPARDEAEARLKLRQMLFFECVEGNPRWRFWLNDKRPY